MAGIASPESIPQLSAASLAPILRALLEAPLKPLTSLSEQCTEAISALPPDARPTSYEGLSDVARFCVEDEPGWEEAERAQLIAGHPRIGERTDKKGAEEMSEESRKEQTVGGAADEATLQRK